MFSRFFRFHSSSVVLDAYEVQVLTKPEQLSVGRLPLEFRYLFAKKPSRIESCRLLMEKGHGIGIRRVRHTPEHLLRAIDQIARRTQANTLLPWLPNLLRHETIPVFSREDLERAESSGVNLYEELKLITAERFEFVRFVLVDLKNQTISIEDQKIVDELNREIYPMAIEWIVHRVLSDNAHTRTEVAQSIIKALVILGPIAHALEHVVHGLGKIFVASADDLLSETAELFALRGSGFSWKELAKRSRILIPIFFLATYGAYRVEGLIDQERYILAGSIFGLSTVALSLTTAIQSIFLYRASYVTLHRDGKLVVPTGRSLTSLAIVQDFSNPARFGLFVGAFASPFVSSFVFFFAPFVLSNGWVLALLASVESLVAGLTVVFSRKIDQFRFHHRLQTEIQRILRAE